MSIKQLSFILFAILSFVLHAQKNNKQSYLNPKLDTETRLDLLMAQMSLEDKVYQMNQFVGLEHMKKAEKDLTEVDLANNDTQGFYKGVFSKDVEAMTKAGKIAGGHIEAPQSKSHACTICQVVRRFVEPEGRDDLLTHQVHDRPARGTTDHHAQHMSVDRDILPVAARRGEGTTNNFRCLFSCAAR